MSSKLGSMVVYQSGGRTIIRRRVYKTRGRRTEPQAQVRAAFARVSEAWKGLSPAQPYAWARLGVRMPDWDGTRGPKLLWGYQSFVAVAWGRNALGLPPLLDAPDAPDLPPFLPALSLAASAADGVLTLTCGPDAFDAPVQVSVARPALPSAPAPRPKDLVLLTVLDALPPGGADFGPLYAAKFGVPAPGFSVTARAVPLSPTGFRGQAVTVSGVVGV